MNGYLSVIPTPRGQDVLDVTFVAYVIYRIALVIRGTRTLDPPLGLAIVAAAFVGSQLLGLFTLHWLLNNFIGSLIVILVVIFQADIRRALTGVGARSLFGARISHGTIANAITAAVSWLAERRIGALIVIEQSIGLQEFVDTGRALYSEVSPELIESIFMTGSPLHDGAVIIKGERLLAAACLLPLSSNPAVSLTLGTRHRAGIGLTEDNDAVVVIVSEEDGTISIARNGELRRGFDAARLLDELQQLSS
jgi:diadenylate cyclase